MKLRLPDRIGTVPGGTDTDAHAEFIQAGNTLSVNLAAHKPVKTLELIWELPRAETRREPVKVFSDCWERGYGELQWSGIIPHRLMPWAFAVTDGSDSDPDTSGRFTECFGVKVRPGAFAMWKYETRRLTLILDVRSGGEGVLLDGRKLKVCDAVFGEYRGVSAFSALKDFYASLCDDAILPETPVYGSNNWYYAYGKSSRELILEDARLISRLSGGNLTPPYMVIDAGWNRSESSGPWEGNNPDYGDMAQLARGIRDEGAIPGIWVRYLSDEAGLLEDIPRQWRSSRNSKYLDPSHPGVIGYIRETTRRLSADWRYKLIKHDFSCYDISGYWGFQRSGALIDDGWSFYDRSRTAAEIMVDMYRAIYTAAAPGTVILACNAPGFLTAGLCHINRAGDDTSGRDWERTRRMGVNTAAFRAMCDGAFYKSDYDCVGIIKNRIPWRLNRTWARLLSHSGTPLFFSIQPDAPGEAEFGELSEFLKCGAVQTDTAVPLDWMENSCPENWLINGKTETFDWINGG